MFVLCKSFKTCEYGMMLYCTVFSVYSNVFVLCMSVNTCEYVFVLYCNVFSVYLTLTFAAPHIKLKKAWNGGRNARVIVGSF